MTLFCFSGKKLPAVFCSGSCGKDSETWQQVERTCDRDTAGMKVFEVQIRLHNCLILPDSARFPPVRSRLCRLSEVAGTPKLARRALCAAEETEGRCELKNYPESS